MPSSAALSSVAVAPSPAPPVPADDRQLFEHVRAAIDDIRDGRMVILVDDEDRENEGDLTLAAQHVTPEAIAFMARLGRGLICLTLTDQQVARLQLPMMAVPGRHGPPLGTAFTVSIEARHGVTTGISAADRAHTIRVAASPSATADDIVTPGHVFPLRARSGGVLVRAGQTEGSVDLARLAGLEPAAVICEIMNDDGTMARMDDLRRFGLEHGLRILSIADLIAYRLRTERVVRRTGEQLRRLERTGTEWRFVTYRDDLGGREILALVKGEPRDDATVLCRVHRGDLLADLFASNAADHQRLDEAIRRVEGEGCGVIVYLPHATELVDSFDAAADRTELRPEELSPLREYGLGAQVLRDLGVRRLRLLTSNPRRLAGLAGYGLELAEVCPLPAPGARPLAVPR